MTSKSPSASKEMLSTSLGSSSGNSTNGGGGGGLGSASDGLKHTLSQAMMNSTLLHSLPKYIFQSEHSRLKSVTSILKEVKEQQSRDAALQQAANTEFEVSEYPIEYYEHQQHAIERQLNSKYVFSNSTYICITL